MAAQQVRRFFRVTVLTPPKGGAAHGLDGGRRLWREPAPVPIAVTEEAQTMTNTLDRRLPAATFLTHYFGGGLIDKGEGYLVERYRSMSCGEIRR